MSEEDGSSSSDSSGSSSQGWIDEFEDLCSSEDLYLSELKSFIGGISLDDFDLSNSPSFTGRV